MLDLAIVIAYLLVVLVVGIVCGRKVGSFEEYSLGRKDFPTTVIVAAIFATMVGGGSTMGISEKIFSSGLSFLLVAMSFIVSDLITAYFIVPKFAKFNDCLTVGDIMAKFYGRTGKISAGVAGVLLSIVGFAMQISAMGFLLQYFLDIPYWLGALIGNAVVVIYSTYGGMRSVTITDVVEFSVLIIAIPLTFSVGVEAVGGLNGLLAAVPKSHLSFVPDSEHAVRHYSLMIAFLIPYMNPVLVQRLLMCRSVSQIKNGLLIASWLRLPYLLMVAVLGLVALVISPNLDANLAFPFLVNELLPMGIRGFVIAGLMAVIMSTADSYLHVCGVLLTHDVVRPLKSGGLSSKAELSLVRYTTFLVGIFATFIALGLQNVFELNVLIFVFWLPAICVPLVAGIFGIKVSIRAFLFSGLCGSSTYLIWRFCFYEYTHIDSMLPGILANALVFFLFKFIENKRSRAN